MFGDAGVKALVLLVVGLMMLCGVVYADDQIYKFKVMNRSTGQAVEVAGGVGDTVKLPGGVALALLGFTENYNEFGPAAQVRIDLDESQDGTPFIVLARFPQFDEKRNGKYIVSFYGIDQ